MPVPDLILELSLTFTCQTMIRIKSVDRHGKPDKAGRDAERAEVTSKN
jgi:hypothetical protein